MVPTEWGAPLKCHKNFEHSLRLPRQKLLVTKGDEWVDLRGAAGWEQAGS